jgi:hypothetical protein
MMNASNGRMTITDGLGEFLRRERELRHITLDDVAEHTKISRRYLEAIEEGRYDRLPGETFVRGFIRSYAQSVGLDPTDTLLMYEQARGIRAVAPSPAEPRSPARRSRQRRALHWPLIAVAAVVGLGLLGVIGAMEGPKFLRFLSTSRVDSDKTAAVSVPLILTVSADADTWVRVTIDHQDEQDMLLRAGQSAKWMGREHFLLSIGNAQAVRLQLNGRALSLPSTGQSLLRHYPVSRDMLP